MITRIISGAVMALIVAAVLLIGTRYTLVLALFLAILAGIAVYEVLFNTKTVKSKLAVVGAVLTSVLSVLAHLGVTTRLYSGLNAGFFALLLVLVTVIAALKNNSDFSLSQISATIAMPIVISFAFSSFAGIYLRENGLFYLLLLLNFSSVCDCGAYFAGVTLGKHKLCPNISPKKTVEGAIGGILSSVIVSAILCLTMADGKKIIPLLLCTVVFCIIGMCGDLFASVIKRNAGIKDYGKLIPGHGGILDRFDSILLIAPVLLLSIEKGLF